MADNKFNLINVGDSFTIEKTITEEMVKAFADFTGDYNPVHMDDVYCSENGYKQRIVHGMLVLSFVSTLIGMHLPGKGSIWMSQNFEFIAPVKIGDKVAINGIVLKKDNTNTLGINIIEMKITIQNQDGQLVTRGRVKVTIK